MRLFSQQGYRATSVKQIEQAAGLVPGCGALYNHFRSKQELLAAVIDRQLDRRRAMHDISALFAGRGDLRTELSLLCRYLMSVLDQESEFLQVVARTPADKSPRLTDAYAALIDGLYSELGDWINALRTDPDSPRPAGSPRSASTPCSADAPRESCSTPTTSTQPTSNMSPTGPT